MYGLLLWCLYVLFEAWKLWSPVNDDKLAHWWVNYPFNTRSALFDLMFLKFWEFETEIMMLKFRSLFYNNFENVVYFCVNFTLSGPTSGNLIKIWLTSLLTVRQYKNNLFILCCYCDFFFSLKGSKCFKRLLLSCFSCSSARLHRVLTECAVLLIHSRFSVMDWERSCNVVVQMF